MSSSHIWLSRQRGSTAAGIRPRKRGASKATSPHLTSYPEPDFWAADETAVERLVGSPHAANEDGSDQA